MKANQDEAFIEFVKLPNRKKGILGLMALAHKLHMMEDPHPDHSMSDVEGLMESMELIGITKAESNWALGYLDDMKARHNSGG
jgi:hypothetical protein